MKKSQNIKPEKKSFVKNTNKQIFFLFVLILTVCIFFDFYFSNSNLTVPFLTTSILSTLITFLGIPKLKIFNIKQIIREEGPKNHFTKQGTPTMGGIFFVPTGIIISNIYFFNKDNYKIVLTLSFLIIFFMIIGFIDDFLSLKKQLNTGLKSNQKIQLQFQ